MSARITPGEEPWRRSTQDTVSVPADLDAVFDDDPSPTDGVPWRPTRERLRRPAWLRGTAGLLVVTAALLTIGGLVYRLSGSGRPPAQEQAPVVAAPSPAADPGASTPPVPAVRDSGSPSDATSLPWQGAALPVSDTAGPQRFTETRSTGFSQDPQGAAFAAVHISTHIDPYTGPDVFTPTIEEQVVAGGDLVERTRRSYEAAARRQGLSREAIADGAPVLAPTGHISAWRISTYRPDAVTTVELLVSTPDGQQVVYEIPVVWRDGDWRVLVDADTGFRTADSRGTAGFTDFIEKDTTPRGNNDE